MEEKSVHRVSTIVIGAGERTEVYHRVDDVPLELRRKLHASVCGENAATLLIADERGREEILRRVRNAASGVESRLFSSLVGKNRKGRMRSLFVGVPRRTWLQLGLLALVGASAWLLALVK
jgi:hypothetical protein